MTINYKELLCGHLKEMYDNANGLQTKRISSRIQARNRSNRSNSLDHAPFEEVRNQDHDQNRPDNSSPV